MNRALVSDILDESESDLTNKATISGKNGNNMDGNAIDIELIKTAVKMILKGIGENPDRPGLIDTPARVAKMYAEMFSGINGDPGKHLRVTFPENYDEMVLVKDIPFTSMCEHHLLPFTGVAHIAYIPMVKLLALVNLLGLLKMYLRDPRFRNE
jgi:GTP cyclohydrolase I